MKKFILSMMAVVFIITAAGPFQAQAEEASLTETKSIHIFYGWPTESKLEELRTYDVVVIAPHAYSKEQIEFIQAAGTTVFGYISVMQLESWNTSFVSEVSESDYYVRDGEKLYIENWDTYIMDIRESHYQQLLQNQVETDIVSKEMDGVFLDTVDDIDYYFHKRTEEQEAFRAAYVELLNRFKQVDSDLLLMQNRGFDTLKAASEPFVDAFLWESFDKKKLESSKWGQKWISYLRERDQAQSLAVFTTVVNKQSVSYAAGFGFVSHMRKNNTYQ